MPPGSYLKPVTSGALAAGSWAERAHSPEGGVRAHLTRALPSMEAGELLCEHKS